MLTFFPEPFEDESVYSLAARYRRLLHSAGPPANADLFGDKHYAAAYDLPQRMVHLAGQMPKGSRLTASRLIRRHTAFPFYRAVLDLDEARGLLKGMMSKSEGRGAWFGVIALGGHIPKPKWLRFCPVCQGEMMLSHGEAYWRRDLQLPGVLLCPRHGCDLRESTAPANRGSMHHPAGVTTCRDDAPSVLLAAPDVDRRDLHDLAQAMVQILRSGRLPDPGAGRIGRLDDTWKAKGLCAGKGVRRGVIRKAVTARFSSFASLWPDLFADRKYKVDLFSLRGLTRGGARLHPILRFMFLRTIDGMTDERPGFGTGPWRCENRLAPHYGQPVVYDGVITFPHKRTRIRLKCECGCEFIKAKLQDGRETKVTIVDLGPLLRVYLRQAHQSQTRLKQMFADTGYGERRLRQVAGELGFEMPFAKDWSRQPRKGMRRRKNETPS